MVKPKNQKPSQLDFGTGFYILSGALSFLAGTLIHNFETNIQKQEVYAGSGIGINKPRGLPISDNKGLLSCEVSNLRPLDEES